MRIAILADIHGNLPALEAVLARVEGLKIDRLVIAGDIVVGAPDSLRCWERVQSLGCPVLRGNHERYVFDLGTPRAKPEWSTRPVGAVQYAAAQLGEENRRKLAALPEIIRLPDAPDLLFVHASMRGDHDLIFPYTSDAEIEPMFAGCDERWIIRGHNHYAAVRPWGRRFIVNTGAVGLPLDGTVKAQFVVMERRGAEWSVEHHAVPYDVQATLTRFRESGYLRDGGPLARLYMREVETAAPHVVPFLKWCGRGGGADLLTDELVSTWLSRE